MNPNCGEYAVEELIDLFMTLDDLEVQIPFDQHTYVLYLHFNSMVKVVMIFRFCVDIFKFASIHVSTLS